VLERRVGTGPDRTDDKPETVQPVGDRVSSYQDGATEGTIADELRRGLDEAGVQLPDDQVRQLADAIEEANGEVFVTDVLGQA
jgi:hypothetical protein